MNSVSDSVRAKGFELPSPTTFGGNMCQEILVEQSRFISSIAVDNLFGYESIRLDFDHPLPGTDRQINILYGENGEGKSTILRLVYSILSSQDQKGLKNWVNRAPFSKAKIEFTDGSYVEVTKGVDKRKGLLFRMKSDSEVVFRMPTNDHGIIANDAKGNQIEEYLAYAASFSPRLFYITDTRNYYTNSTIVERAFADEAGRTTYRVDTDGRLQAVDSRSTESMDVEVMSRLITNVFRDEIYESGVLGQQDSNQVYEQLVGGIATSGSGTLKYSRESILQEIDLVERLTDRAATIGVATGFNAEYFRGAVKAASRININKIALVVVPYLDSIKARVSAASKYVDRMHSFLSELNHFYRDKQFNFDVSTGFTVRSLRTSAGMDSNWLSSGERQLFIILSSIFLTQRELRGNCYYR